MSYNEVLNLINPVNQAEYMATDDIFEEGEYNYSRPELSRVSSTAGVSTGNFINTEEIHTGYNQGTPFKFKIIENDGNSYTIIDEKSNTINVDYNTIQDLKSANNLLFEKSKQEMINEFPQFEKQNRRFDFTNETPIVWEQIELI